MFLRFSFVAPGAGGFRFEQQIPWVNALGIGYHVGVDGINVGLVLMGAIVAFAAACCSWEIREREKEFYILLLVMTGGILGAFASLDMFFLYFFHELALIPTFIMIGVWGRGERRNYAAFQITLYLTIGAMLALAGLIALYVQSGAHTFDIPTLTNYIVTQQHPLSTGAQRFVFPLLLFGFGILVSLWPFHTWAPLKSTARLLAHRHAACRRAEEIRALRFDSDRAALDAGGGAALDARRGVVVPGQPRLLRVGGHATEEFQPAHRLFERGAHGFCIPWASRRCRLWA